MTATTTQLSPASAALLERAAASIPGGVNTCRRRSEPRLCFARGQGAYLWDLEGRRYVDYHAAYGAIFLGHSHPEVTERVARATRERVLFGVGVTEAEVELAETLTRHIPCAEQVVVCNSGSEATYHAIRLARGVTAREKILKFAGFYNGFHDSVLVDTVTPGPGSAGMLQASVDATIVCRFNDLDDVEQAFARNPEQIAAVVVEPIAHNSPGIMPAPGFLEGLRAVCDREETLLVFDEVITGVRHHLGGAQKILGVTPDLATFGKAIANGYPLAAVAGRRAHMERFNTTATGDVHFGGTYNGGTVGVEAALATLQHLERHPVHDHVYRLGERMREGLREIGAEAGIPVLASGYGSLFVLLFMEGPLNDFTDVLRNDAKLFGRYRRELVARGIFEMPESLGRSHISAAHTDDDVDRSLEAARDALRAALGI
jgi:glutamate-1-semialdehyde 2,1-aminomutase